MSVSVVSQCFSPVVACVRVCGERGKRACAQSGGALWLWRRPPTADAACSYRCKCRCGCCMIIPSYLIFVRVGQLVFACRVRIFLVLPCGRMLKCLYRRVGRSCLSLFFAAARRWRGGKTSEEKLVFMFVRSDVRTFVQAGCLLSGSFPDARRARYCRGATAELERHLLGYVGGGGPDAHIGGAALAARRGARTRAWLSTEHTPCSPVSLGLACTAPRHPDAPDALALASLREARWTAGALGSSGAPVLRPSVDGLVDLREERRD